MIGKTLIIIGSLHSTHAFKWLQTSIQTTTIYSLPIYTCQVAKF